MIVFSLLMVAQVAGSGLPSAGGDIFSPPLITLPVAPDRQAQPATPLSNPGAWVGTADYPPEALRAGHEGTVGFTLAVGADGVPQGCTITQSSGDVALDGATCALLAQRARFSPAKDATGSAVVGRYSSRVMWKIPKTRPQPQDGDLVTSFIVGVDGTLSDCRIERASGSAGAAASMPSPCQTGQKTAPYLDAKGAATARRVTIRHTITVTPAP